MTTLENTVHRMYGTPKIRYLEDTVHRRHGTSKTWYTKGEGASKKLFETKTARFSFQSGFQPQTVVWGLKNCVP